MPVQRAYKTELDLTDWQITPCKQHAGKPRRVLSRGMGRCRRIASLDIYHSSRTLDTALITGRGMGIPRPSGRDKMPL
jgi:hypothetical protein